MIRVEDFLKMTKKEMTSYLQKASSLSSLISCTTSKSAIDNISNYLDIKVSISNPKCKLIKKLHQYCYEFSISSIGAHSLDLSSIAIVVLRKAGTGTFIVASSAILDSTTGQVIKIEDEFGRTKSTLEDRFIELCRPF